MYKVKRQKPMEMNDSVFDHSFLLQQKLLEARTTSGPLTRKELIRQLNLKIEVEGSTSDLATIANLNTTPLTVNKLLKKALTSKRSVEAKAILLKEDGQSNKFTHAKAVSSIVLDIKNSNNLSVEELLELAELSESIDPDVAAIFKSHLNSISSEKEVSGNEVVGTEMNQEQVPTVDIAFDSDIKKAVYSAFVTKRGGLSKEDLIASINKLNDGIATAVIASSSQDTTYDEFMSSYNVIIEKRAILQEKLDALGLDASDVTDEQALLILENSDKSIKKLKQLLRAGDKNKMKAQGGENE